MRRNKNIKRIFFLSAIASVMLLLVGLLGHKSYCLARDSFSHALIPDRIVLSMHDFYSQDVKSDIEYFLWRELACDTGGSVSSAFLCKTLKDNFKIISRISWHQDSFGQAELIIYGTHPKFLLSKLFTNNQFVVGSKRALFSKDLFREYPVASLKSLSVKSSFLHEKISHRLHQFLQKVPDWCWDDYTLSYLGPNEIFLDKTCLDGESDGRKYRVVTDEHLGVTRPVLVEIPTFYDDCMTRKKIEKSSWFYRTRRFVCDTRFDGVMYTKFDYDKV